MRREIAPQGRVGDGLIPSDIGPAGVELRTDLAALASAALTVPKQR